MSWFYLALLAPLLYAILNLIDDNMVQYVYESPYMAATLAGIFGALPLLSLTFFHAEPIAMKYSLQIMLAGFLMTIFFFLYFKSFSLEQPSVVIAILGLAPATLPFLAHFLLNESLSRLQIAGFMVVLTATTLLAATDIRKLKFTAALIPILIAVVFYDILSLLSKNVYENVPFYPAYMFFSTGLGLGGLYFLLIMIFKGASKEFRTLKVIFKKVILILLISQAVGLAAMFVTNLAISRGPLSIISVMEGTQPMFMLIIAIALFPFAPKYFREAAHTGKTRKFILMGIILAGLVLINIGITS